MKHIDPHCHCRDGKEAYKTNIREVSEIAESQGITAIFDMPNTTPPILTEKDVRERLKLAERRQPKVKYFLYVGLTSDENQIQEAVKVVEDYPEVVGLKLYTARGGSGLKVSRGTDQKKIYGILADLNYQGVLAVHCEKESEFRPELWNPKDPKSHSLAQPPAAEIESIKGQISFARKTNFKGNLHICHISCPESVDLVWRAKKDINITSGVTPHHLLMTREDVAKQGAKGLLLKVNPPLRDLNRVKELRKRVLELKIDWIETDHAPHALKEKINHPYLSGIASMNTYQSFLSWLNKQGISWSQIENLTYGNIKKVFGEKLAEV